MLPAAVAFKNNWKCFQLMRQLHWLLLTSPRTWLQEALDLAGVPAAEFVQVQAEPAKVPRPQYETIKRNIWLSKARPKRLPLDEMETCNCSVIRGAHMPPPSHTVLVAASAWQR